MCINSADLIPSSTLNYAFGHVRPSKRHSHLLVRRLNRRRSRSSKNEKRKEEKESLKAKLEIKNLKLYMENQSIMQENEKLRKKALVLDQENRALLSQLQKKLPCSHNQKLIHNYNH